MLQSPPLRQAANRKELQTGEFDPMVSTGLEMLDFGSRFYDTQLGRWFTPDPAEQFANPYLAMGNNPVVYVDPDGEWVHLAIGAVIGGTLNLLTNLDNINNFWDSAKYFGVGAAAGALAAGVGAGISSTMAGGSFGSGFIGSQAAMSVSSSFVSGATIGAGSGFTGGFVSGFGNTGIQGGNIGQMFGTGLEYGWKGAVSGAIVGGISGGIDASRDGRKFWSGKSIDKPNLSLRELNNLQASIDKISFDDLQGFKADFSSDNDFSEALKMYRAHRLRDLNQMPTEFREFIDTRSLQDGVNGWKNTRFKMFWVKEWQTPAGTITLRMQADWSRVVSSVSNEGNTLFIWGQHTGITWPDLSQFIFNNNSVPMFWNYVNNGIQPKW